MVEDSVLLRELMIEAFAAIPGIIVSGHAETEDDAYEQIQKFSCDILVVDIQLRQGNGISLIRRLLARGEQNAFTRIILSNNVSPAFRQATAQLAPCFFFDKTAEFDALQQFLIELTSSKAPAF